MQKYISTPEVTLHGTAFMSIFKASEFDQFKADYEAALAAYGVKEIHPDEWYPRQMYLDVFRRLTAHDTNVSTNMISAGIHIIDTIQLPPEIRINSMIDALELLNQVYRLDQRNLPADDVGYIITQEGTKHVRVVDLSPYPHDVNYGYIYGLMKRFAPKGTHPVLRRKFINESQPDSDGAIYDIVWD